MKAPLPPILFRIVGIAGDGQTVTLGKYRTEAEAEADHARFAKEAYYRNLSIQKVPPPKPPAEKP